MYPPLFSTLFASTSVKAIFGSAPLRVYPFGDAPAKGSAGYALPYAVFQTVGGSPENYLNQAPDLDNWRPQMDVYAASLTLARNAAEAVRDALEPVAYIVSWNGEFRDSETQLFRISFDLSFQTPR